MNYYYNKFVAKTSNVNNSNKYYKNYVLINPNQKVKNFSSNNKDIKNNNSFHYNNKSYNNNNQYFQPNQYFNIFEKNQINNKHNLIRNLTNKKHENLQSVNIMNKNNFKNNNFYINNNLNQNSFRNFYQNFYSGLNYIYNFNIGYNNIINNNNKPTTVYDYKRPSEKLKKGQNQLILERMQENYLKKIKNEEGKKMPKTSMNFFKKFPINNNNNHQYKNSDINNINKSDNININANIIERNNNSNLKSIKSANYNKVKTNKSIVIESKNKENIDNKDFIKTITQNFFNNNNNNIKRMSNIINNNSTDKLFNFNENNKNKETKNIFESKLNHKISYNNDDDIKIEDVSDKNNLFKFEQGKFTYNNFDKQTNNNNENNKNDSTINNNKLKHCKSMPKLQTNYILNKVSSIFENPNINKENNDNKNNINNENKTKENKETNYDSKFKTSSNFFKQSQNSNSNKTTEFDINNIINRVIENNKRAGAFKSTNFFNNIGKDFMNNHMRQTHSSFYNKNSKYNNYNKFTGSDTNYTNDMLNNDNKFHSLNSLKINLINPLSWRKHEEIWANIQNLAVYNVELEKYLIPPNDNDVLISSYLKLFPNVLNFCSLNKINTNNNNDNNNDKNYLFFYIDDKISNPKNEMKKWRDAYKRVILRWHPDKLYSFLNDIKIKDENIKNNLKKKSTVIINNMNTKFKNIIEILRKIKQRKDNNTDND